MKTLFRISTQMVLRKALSASQTTMDQLLLPSMARVYMRVSYDTVTHVVSVLLIQSNKLQHSERQKLYPRIQFGVFICNGEMQSTLYKTQVQSNLDLIDIKETFYFPNVDQSTISDHSVVLHVTGKDRLFFGTERLLSQGSLLLDKFSVGEQLYCSVLMEENVVSKSLWAMNFEMSNRLFILENRLLICRFVSSLNSPLTEFHFKWKTYWPLYVIILITRTTGIYIFSRKNF